MLVWGDAELYINVKFNILSYDCVISVIEWNTLIYSLITKNSILKT